MPPALIKHRVHGLTAVIRELDQFSDSSQRQIVMALRTSLDPVGDEAKGLAVARIRKVGPVWRHFRTGVSEQPSWVHVFIVPAKRATTNPRLKRPNFAGLLTGRAMRPAMKKHLPRLRRDIDKVLTRMHRKGGF